MDRERKAFEEWARREFALRHDESLSWRDGGVFVVDPQRPNVPRAGLIIPFAWAAWDARAALSRAPGEATEAMVEAGARAAATFVVNQLRGCIAVGSLKTMLEKDPAVLIEQAVAAAMRAESEGGGAAVEKSPAAFVESRVDSPAAAGGATAFPGATGPAPPSPGSDLLREVEAFLRAIGARVNDAALEALNAMRAESEGGGVVKGEPGSTGDPARAGQRGPETAPPSPGSDLLREVHAFLRAIGGSEYIDTKDAATARELAGELRDLLPTPPAQEGGDDA